MTDTAASARRRRPDDLSDHPALTAYADDLADRIARAHRDRPGGSDAATEDFLATVADGLERRNGRPGGTDTSDTGTDGPEEAADAAERAARAGDGTQTIDFVGRAMARHGRRMARELETTDGSGHDDGQERPASTPYADAGPLTLFFVEPGTLVTNELLSEAAGYPTGPVLPPGAGLPTGLTTVTGYVTEVSEEFDPADRTTFDYISTCLVDTLGLRDIAYFGAGLAGLPSKEKPRVGIGGSNVSKKTSLSSKYFRRLFPQHLPFNVWAPTAGKFLSGTAQVGGILGRWVPLVGWALLAYDAARFGTCLYEAAHRANELDRDGAR